MLYRPHFCCHCGEKIVRAKWTPLTSRRFCDFCAIEQKQHDLLPRAAAILLLIFGAAGITSYLGSGNSAAKRPTQRPPSSAESENGPAKLANTFKPVNRNVATPPAVFASNSSQPAANAKQLAPNTEPSTEPVYYCGALTKKGAACTRRVKTPGRCWQHLGQPLAAERRK